MENQIFTEDQLFRLSMLPMGSVIDIYSDITKKPYVLEVVPFTRCIDCFFGKIDNVFECSFYLESETRLKQPDATHICTCQNSIHSKVPLISYKQI